MLVISDNHFLNVGIKSLPISGVFDGVILESSFESTLMSYKRRDFEQFRVVMVDGDSVSKDKMYLLISLLSVIKDVSKIVVLTSNTNTKVISNFLSLGGRAYDINLPFVGLSDVISDFFDRDNKESGNVDWAPEGSTYDYEPLTSVTKQEVKVIRLFYAGHKASDIARMLNKSIKTICTQKSNVLKKLKLDNKATSIITAFKITERVRVD